MASQQRPDVEFLSAIKAEIGLSDILSEHAIGPDYARFALSEAIAGFVVNHQKVVADLVEGANVAPHQSCGALPLRRRLLRKTP